MHTFTFHRFSLSSDIHQHVLFNYGWYHEHILSLSACVWLCLDLLHVSLVLVCVSHTVINYPVGASKHRRPAKNQEVMTAYLLPNHSMKRVAANQTIVEEESDSDNERPLSCLAAKKLLIAPSLTAQSPSSARDSATSKQHADNVMRRIQTARWISFYWFQFRNYPVKYTFLSVQLCVVCVYV